MHARHHDVSATLCILQCQLDLFLWLLTVNDVDEVPSVKSVQTLNAMLQKMCGVDGIKYKGALGHILTM
jgi:hypothetical protein